MHVEPPNCKATTAERFADRAGLCAKSCGAAAEKPIPFPAESPNRPPISAAQTQLAHILTNVYLF
jgi:hypothetical protein